MSEALDHLKFCASRENFKAQQYNVVIFILLSKRWASAALLRLSAFSSMNCPMIR